MSAILCNSLRSFRPANCFSRFAAPRFFSHSQHLLGLPTDPTLRRLALDRNAERKRLRYANDPEFREREKARCLKRQRKKDDETRKQDVTRWVARIRQKRIEDPLTRLYSVIDRWVRSVIDKPVQWSTHRPVVHAEKVGLRCEDCTRESFRKAALWWHDVHNPEKQLCRMCFVKRWPEGLPHDYEYRTNKNGMKKLYKKDTTKP